MKNFMFNALALSNINRNRRYYDVVCRAVSSGVVPTSEEIKAVIAAVPMAAEVKAFYDLMDPFSGKLKDVSDKQAGTYAANVEANAALILVYAKDQYSKCYTGTPSGTVDSMFNATAIGEATAPNATALPRLASLLSKGHTYGFWDAVTIHVQKKRDLEQQVNDSIGMTIKEFKEAQTSLTVVSAGYAFNAKTTQSRDYILSASKAQKIEDTKAFDAWVIANSSHYAAIIRLNLSDLPFSYAATELISFERDQKDSKKKAAVTNKLNALKKEALEHVRQELAKNANQKIDIGAWLKTK